MAARKTEEKETNVETLLNGVKHEETRQYWNAQAKSFDEEPDHGLRDPVLRAAWTKLLKRCLPEAPVSILDIGCGTGSLSLVLAGLNHRVLGIDFSEAMILEAARKARASGAAARP